MWHQQCPMRTDTCRDMQRPAQVVTLVCPHTHTPPPGAVKEESAPAAILASHSAGLQNCCPGAESGEKLLMLSDWRKEKREESPGGCMILPPPQHPQMGICQQLMTVTLLHWGQGGPGHGVRAVTQSPAEQNPFVILIHSGNAVPISAAPRSISKYPKYIFLK